jgi:hypothetical protein
MGSKRMIITLPDEDKAWLTSYSKANNISAAEAIRQAIRNLKNGSEIDTYRALLESTRGTWMKEDGLKYQEKIRSEWDSR